MNRFDLWSEHPIPTYASSVGYQSRRSTAFCGGPSMPSIWQFQLVSPHHLKTLQHLLLILKK
jgi:hypothetical protein